MPFARPQLSRIVTALGVFVGVPSAAPAALSWDMQIAARPVVAQWKFDQAAGNILDTSGNGNTLGGTAGFAYSQAGWKTGTGAAVQCNSVLATGADNAPLRLLGDFTIGIVVKCPTAAGIINKLWVYKGNTYSVGTNATGKVEFNYPNVGNAWTSVAAIPANAYVFIAITRIGTHVSIYINGALDSAGTQLSTQAAVFDVVYCGSTQADLLDEVFLLSAGLTAPQVLALQNSA